MLTVSVFTRRLSSAKHRAERGSLPAAAEAAPPGTPWLPVFPRRARMLRRAGRAPEATRSGELELGLRFWCDPQTPSLGRGTRGLGGPCRLEGVAPHFPLGCCCWLLLAGCKDLKGPQTTVSACSPCAIFPLDAWGGGWGERHLPCPPGAPGVQASWPLLLSSSCPPLRHVKPNGPVQTLLAPFLFPVGGLWLLSTSNL